jgi:integrase
VVTILNQIYEEDFRGFSYGFRPGRSQRMHEPVAETGKWLRSVVQSYFNCHAVPGNTDSLHVFRWRVTRLRRQVHPKVIQAVLGWDQLSMVDRYTQFVDEMRKDAADKMDAIPKPDAVNGAQPKAN